MSKIFGWLVWLFREIVVLLPVIGGWLERLELRRAQERIAQISVYLKLFARLTQRLELATSVGSPGGTKLTEGELRGIVESLVDILSEAQLILPDSAPASPMPTMPFFPPPPRP